MTICTEETSVSRKILVNFLRIEASLLYKRVIRSLEMFSVQLTTVERPITAVAVRPEPRTGADTAT